MRRTFIAIFFAVGGIVTLAACNNGQGTADVTHAGNDTTGMARISSGPIAYVNIDSLMSRYDLFLELSEALEAKAKKAETDLASRGRSLERSLADANEKVEKGLVTRAQAAELQEELQRKEQNFMQFRERIQMELSEENQVMMNRIYYSLDSFLREFNSDYRYSMILSTSGGAPVLHADPSLDITEEVLRGLNRAYAEEKKQN